VKTGLRWQARFFVVLTIEPKLVFIPRRQVEIQIKAAGFLKPEA
jgi:hypothetical protein